MNHISKFEEWRNVNESVTPEQKNKVFDEAEKWAKGLGLDVTSNLEGGWFMVHLMGTWTLSLEASTAKKGQDSMYRQTYTRDYDNLKWYIEYPASFNQYNARGNKKPGNLKSFKALIEKFQKIYENLLYVEKFLETLGVERKIERQTTRFEGKNLKDLGVTWNISGDGIDGSIGYDEKLGYFSRYKMSSNAYGRHSFNPEKGEIFYFGALAAKNKIEESGNDFEMIDSILEILKDRPREEVWKMIEKGDWKSLADRFRGKLSGKKFGL